MMLPVKNIKEENRGGKDWGLDFRAWFMLDALFYMCYSTG